MTDLLADYRRLERELADLRDKTGEDAPEGADAIMDEMDVLWWKLSDVERRMLNSEPAQTWPS